MRSAVVTAVRSLGPLAASPQHPIKPPNADVPMRSQRSPKLVKEFIPAVQPAIRAPRNRNQLSRRERQQPSPPAELGAISGTILRPANRSAESGWAELVRIENLLDKDPQRSFESAEQVVNGDDG